MDKRKLRNDIILVASILFAAAVMLAVLMTTGKTGAFVTVTVDGEETLRLPLGSDTERMIESEGGGYNLLVIKGGEAYISEASCPDGICSSHRPIKHEGRTIVCLPNKVVITVVGQSSEPPVDAVS